MGPADATDIGVWEWIGRPCGLCSCCCCVILRGQLRRGVAVFSSGETLRRRPLFVVVVVRPHELTLTPPKHPKRGRGTRRRRRKEVEPNPIVETGWSIHPKAIQQLMIKRKGNGGVQRNRSRVCALLACFAFFFVPRISRRRCAFLLSLLCSRSLFSLVLRLPFCLPLSILRFLPLCVFFGAASAPVFGCRAPSSSDEQATPSFLPPLLHL